MRDLHAAVGPTGRELGGAQALAKAEVDDGLSLGEQAGAGVLARLCYTDQVAFRLDTAPEAWAVQLDIWRRMGPAKRVEVAMVMSEELIEVTRLGIRGRHPEYDDDAVRLAEIRQRLDDELSAKAYPDARPWDA